MSTADFKALGLERNAQANGGSGMPGAVCRKASWLKRLDH